MPTLRFCLDLRPDPPSGEQYAGGGFPQPEPMATVAAAFVGARQQPWILWQLTDPALERRLRPNKPGIVPLSAVGRAGVSHLRTGVVSPRAFEWRWFDLRGADTRNWVARWEEVCQPLLERSDVANVALFEDTSPGASRIAVLLAAHRFSDLDSAWERLVAAPSARSRMAPLLNPGTPIAPGVRLNPMPWSPVR